MRVVEGTKEGEWNLAHGRNFIKTQLLLGGAGAPSSCSPLSHSPSLASVLQILSWLSAGAPQKSRAPHSSPWPRRASRPATWPWPWMITSSSPSWVSWSPSHPWPPTSSWASRPTAATAGARPAKRRRFDPGTSMPLTTGHPPWLPTLALPRPEWAARSWLKQGQETTFVWASTVGQTLC